MLSCARVLLISSNEVEASALEGILREEASLQSVRNISELQAALAKGGYDAVFCGWSFQRGTWLDALKEAQQRRPNLPVIIFSRTGGEREWLEVIEAGAFDLLTAPYVKRHVLPVLEHAVLAGRLPNNNGSYSSSEWAN